MVLYGQGVYKPLEKSIGYLISSVAVRMVRLGMG